ncbi:DUF4012 domain-containing protein [Nocardioides seonyuensis]|uniref:DUF4012 domain-containing protein n=1 Tax=Nocardioides seonyuensis TaxID=2518371 RepID=A0A4P7IF59_9ACTN|nr:DUF4012 domain-containing protein [Nocardioides seonyuensis]QBX55894.1 DUF4012 domain-containing protein [Nocardioides seonyuensis]
MPRSRSDKRRRVWPLLLLAAVVVVVALALLALPFRDAPAHAEAAKTELQSASEALSAGDHEAAGVAVARARDEVDELQGSVQGIGGDAWAWVPVAAGPVRDVRRLGNALDDLTAAAELGVEMWPEVTGRTSTLIDDGNVDLPTLDRTLDRVGEIEERFVSANDELAGVADERVFVGDRLAQARDEAHEKLEPLMDDLASVRPLLDVLPSLLGAEEERQYLIAMLNPAEMMASGGTPQSFATMSFEDGRVDLSDSVDYETAPGTFVPRFWQKVEGNPFHRGRLRMGTATMAPDWRVSGNELANAWRSLRNRPMSGVIAIDTIALSRLIDLTGPIELPPLGRLTGDTLVEALGRSYDRFPDKQVRKGFNRRLVPIFRERLLSSGSWVEKGEVLADAADGRHFAVYLRNAEAQGVIHDLGLSGALSDTDRDYLGVFTQNAVPSKADYWQDRAVHSEVELAEDGSARVRLRVEIHNDSPPYAQPGVDPRSGYWTRWNTLSVMTMLPKGASIVSRSVDGEPVRRAQNDFFGRTYQRQKIVFEPQQTRTLEVVYDVPAAAEVGADGSLAYGLDLDPQGMVRPQAVRVDVTFPRGFEVGDLPDGWRSRAPRQASYVTKGLTTSESFEVVASP